MSNFLPSCGNSVAPDSQRLVVPTHLNSSLEDQHLNRVYCSNVVKTTKYSIFTFLPKNLFEQMHRIANIYFVFVAILNFVPVVNAVNKWAGLAPLLFVLSVTSVKDAFEDYRRYCSDKKVNSGHCLVYNSSSSHPGYVRTLWRNVRVGDIVKLSCDEAVPADIVILSSANTQGICYVDTANLDGESNLKQKQVALWSRSQMGGEFHPASFTHAVQCEVPKKDIYSFSGFIVAGKKEKSPISINNLVLRGCSIRNTKSVEGMVIYTGHETKMLMNNQGPRYKRSKVEQHIDRDVLWCLLILFIMSLVSAICAGIFHAKHYKHGGALYIPLFDSKESQGSFLGFVQFWRYIILYQGIIPLPMYVTIELVKLGQIYFIKNDKHLRRADTGKAVQCRNLSIPEDLGQVEYVFSDKTGTLTENQMVFKSFSVNGFIVDYPKQCEEEDLLLYKDSHISNTSKKSNQDDTKYHPPARAVQFALDLKIHSSVVDDFLTALAVCNTVVVNSTDSQIANGNGNSKYCCDVTNFKELYAADSPDELALVRAACSYDVTLISRNASSIRVQYPGGKVKSFTLLHTIEFDSVRKCQSVVLEDSEKDEIILYCKGADSAVLSKLHIDHDDNLTAVTVTHLNSFALKGLRTLCIAKKSLSKSEFHAWKHQYDITAQSSSDHHEETLRQLNRQLEDQLYLLGATGVEDRLQEYVSETITALRQAGISVWVLTGDKQETAISTAYSCNLLSSCQHIIKINGFTETEVQTLLDSGQHHLEMTHIQAADKNIAVQMGQSGDSTVNNTQVYINGAYAGDGSMEIQHNSKHSSISNPPYTSSSKREVSLVVDGPTLDVVLGNLQLEEKFLQVSTQCVSVLCARSTPYQKAAVVELVKKRLGKLTLAVGDGANDVSMIQMANVGVGISGNEGKQAVMASDFALPRFYFLKRLLLLHGHWCYDRLARMAHYMWYKNIMFVLVLLLYQCYSCFTGSYAYNDYNLLFYNRFYTSVPPVFFGVWEQDIQEEKLLKEAHLYAVGRQNSVYTKRSFWRLFLMALWEALVVFYIPYLMYNDSPWSYWEFGITVYISLVWQQLAHVAITIHHWSFIQLVGIVFSLIAVYSISLVIDATCLMCVTPVETYKVFVKTLRAPVHWLCLLLILVVASLPRIIIKVAKNTFLPSLTTIARLGTKTQTPLQTPQRKVMHTPRVQETPL